MNKLSDYELIEKAQAGDRGAFDELYNRYKRRVLNFVYRMIGNRETAEELTQETFVKVYMNLANFKPKGKVSSWIYTIASNLTKNEFRDRKYFHDISLETVLFDEETKMTLLDVIATQKERPDKVVENKELCTKIQEVFDSIPFHYKQVLILCDLQGASYEEVAHIVGCSVGTVASRLSRARTIFMKRFGVYIDKPKREEK